VRAIFDRRKQKVGNNKSQTRASTASSTQKGEEVDERADALVAVASQTRRRAQTKETTNYF
jgi:hypothetical protein